jgi:hypothetical protein
LAALLLVSRSPSAKEARPAGPGPGAQIFTATQATRAVPPMLSQALLEILY